MVQRRSRPSLDHGQMIEQYVPGLFVLAHRDGIQIYGTVGPDNIGEFDAMLCQAREDYELLRSGRTIDIDSAMTR